MQLEFTSDTFEVWVAAGGRVKIVRNVDKNRCLELVGPEVLSFETLRAAFRRARPTADEAEILVACWPVYAHRAINDDPTQTT